MPELPEVQAFKNYFDESSLDQRIATVRVHDDKIIRNVTGESFESALKGRKFVSSFRRGKYLFPRLDNGHHILLHFGMTGDLKYYSEDEDPPRHERFVLDFEDGFKLGFDCPRKFARICYLEDVDSYIEGIGLGPDALEVDSSYLISKAKSRNGTIKGFLLDQKVVAGIGNLYADEALFQSRIHPASTTSAISKVKQKELFAKIREILKIAVEKNPNYKDYPEDWFWSWRVEGAPGPRGKGKIETAKIGGRTTYFCRQWQKMYAI